MPVIQCGSGPFLCLWYGVDASLYTHLTIPPSTVPPPSRRMIAAVDTDSPREVFFRVASEMFSDGNFNWGRVVALFYFASKLVLKVGGYVAMSPGAAALRVTGTWES